jgi:hypothetical protein
MGLAANFSGCLYTNIHTPWAYRTSTPADLETSAGDKVVTGQSCDKMVLYLFAWGNSGYQAAVKNALGENPGGNILYDVKTDIHVNAYVLGLYSKTCTVVTGRVGHL